MRCSRPCKCTKTPPQLGTADYAREREHADAGDLTLIEVLTHWVGGGVPYFLGRYADGEFDAMAGRVGTQGDGSLRTREIGAELSRVLREVGAFLVCNPTAPILVGGDWGGCDRRRNLAAVHFGRVPWVPNQPLVNGIVSGEVLGFFRAMVSRRERIFLIGNTTLRPVAAPLSATLVEIPARDSFSARQAVYSRLRDQMQSGDIALYCAGMPSAVFAWDMWREIPGTTHMDVGHFFDGAVGVTSRIWLADEGNERLTAYRRDVVPRILGDVPW